MESIKVIFVFSDGSEARHTCWINSLGVLRDKIIEASNLVGKTLVLTTVNIEGDEPTEKD